LDGPRQVNDINRLDESKDIRFKTTKVSKEERIILAAKRTQPVLSTVVIPAADHSKIELKDQESMRNEDSFVLSSPTTQCLTPSKDMRNQPLRQAMGNNSSSPVFEIISQTSPVESHAT
jgi:hypothetical protein